MRGSRWPVPARRACPTAARSTSGASAWRPVRAIRPAHLSAGAAKPTVQLPSMPSASGTNGCASIAPPGAADLRLLPVSAGALARQRRAADLLVHGLHRGDGQAEEPGQQHGRRQGQSAVAHGAVAAWALLGRGHEARLPGCRLMDALQLDPGRPSQGRLALCPVHGVEDRVAKRSHVGLTIIRDSDIRHKSFTDRAPKLGGLVEFYRSPDRVLWTPTGINVPDYPKLAQLWWQNIGDVTAGAFTRPAGHGSSCQGDGPGDGPHGGRRQEGEGLRRLRPAAECREGPEGVARKGRTARRPSSPTRSRKARPSPTMN